MNSQARVLKQMLQLHFEEGVVVRSRVAVKVMRRQWQEPLYSLRAILTFGGADLVGERVCFSGEVWGARHCDATTDDDDNDSNRDYRLVVYLQ